MREKKREKRGRRRRSNRRGDRKGRGAIKKTEQQRQRETKSSAKTEAIVFSYNLISEVTDVPLLLLCAAGHTDLPWHSLRWDCLWL